MLIRNFNNNNLQLNKEILFLFSLYISLLISFYFGENSTGGAILDYNNQKIISSKFLLNFEETFYNFDKFSTRHSPVLIILLSFLEMFFSNDMVIRFIHLHICIILPFLFFKVLCVKFDGADKKILLLLSGLIFLSPTFRSLSIWPDSRILGLTFFLFSIYFFLKFEIKLSFKFAVLNILTCAFSAYLSPNFSVFSLFFLFKFMKVYGLMSPKILLICLLNLILAVPALYYIFILDINFLNKSAAINIDNNDKIFFNNIFNDILITFSITLFYLLPFLIVKLIKIEKIYKIRNIIYSLLLFSTAIFFFDYQYEYSGGGVFFKFSNQFFNNNLFFYIITFISILIILPFLLSNRENLFLFVLILINNPQYTIYHKYFDPFLLIIFFSLFNFKISLLGEKNKSFILIYTYFLMFLITSNLKFIWTT